MIALKLVEIFNLKFLGELHIDDVFKVLLVVVLKFKIAKL